MRAIVLGLAVITAFASAQDRDRTFYLTHAPTIQQFQEVATVIRTIANIREVSADEDQKSVTVHTTPGQIDMAEWLFNELDNPAVQTSVPHQYLVPGAADDVVRVFYITSTANVQDFQQIATLVRTISNITRVFTYNAPKALVVRDTAAQVQLAEWLVKELDQPASDSSHEYRIPGGKDDIVHVLYLAKTGSVQAFQSAAIQIRATTQITRAFTYNAPKAFAVRGTADQIALAERLAMDLDHP
jgi:hypothetical protein